MYSRRWRHIGETHKASANFVVPQNRKRCSSRWSAGTDGAIAECASPSSGPAVVPPLLAPLLPPGAGLYAPRAVRSRAMCVQAVLDLCSCAATATRWRRCDVRRPSNTVISVAAKPRRDAAACHHERQERHARRAEASPIGSCTAMEVVHRGRSAEPSVAALSHGTTDRSRDTSPLHGAALDSRSYLAPSQALVAHVRADRGRPSRALRAWTTLGWRVSTPVALRRGARWRHVDAGTSPTRRSEMCD